MEANFGKRELLIDNIEIINVRTFMGTSFKYKFELENLIFEIRRDEEGYDIYETQRVHKKFKDIQAFQGNVVAPVPSLKNTNRYQNMFLEP